MNRLTTHDPNRRLVACRANYESWNAIYDRLAAYEDTGLEPQEIAELVDHNEITPQQEYFINEKADNIIAGIEDLLAGMNKRNRAMKLLQAESEGRLIVLPSSFDAETIKWMQDHWTTFLREAEAALGGDHADRSD